MALDCLNLKPSSKLCYLCVELPEVYAVSILTRKVGGKYCNTSGLVQPSEFDNFLTEKIYDEEAVRQAETFFDRESRREHAFIPDVEESEQSTHNDSAMIEI